MSEAIPEALPEVVSKASHQEALARIGALLENRPTKTQVITGARTVDGQQLPVINGILTIPAAIASTEAPADFSAALAEQQAAWAGVL